MPVPPSPTRRQLFGGGAAGVAVLAGVRSVPAVAAPLPTDARPDVIHRGRALAVSRNGSHIVVAHAARHTLAITDRRTRKQRKVTLHGQPLELAVAPHGDLLAVTTASWDGPGLELLSLADDRRHVTLNSVGNAPFAPAFTPDAKHLVVSAGEQDGRLHVLRAPAFSAGKTVALGRVPRGLAVTNSFAWVAVQADNVIAKVDLRTGHVLKRMAVAALPDRVALSADGRRLLVSHGGSSTKLTELDTHTGAKRVFEAGGRVSAVAYGSSGRRLAALIDSHQVLVIERSGRKRRLSTVASPRSLARAGRHVFSVSATDASIGRVKA